MKKFMKRHFALTSDQEVKEHIKKYDEKFEIHMAFMYSSPLIDYDEKGEIPQLDVAKEFN